MKTKLFKPNKPESFTGTIALTITKHARERAMLNKWGVQIDLPTSVNLDTCELRELELIEVRSSYKTYNMITDALLLVPFNARFNLLLAITNTGVLKSCWLNEVGDEHATLNPNNYANLRAK